jgi:hypothetical protein
MPKQCLLCGDELEDESCDYCPVCEEALWEAEHGEFEDGDR